MSDYANSCSQCGQHYAAGLSAQHDCEILRRENTRLRQVIEETASVLTGDLACRPADECPDLSAYADGHCDLVALAKQALGGD